MGLKIQWMLMLGAALDRDELAEPLVVEPGIGLSIYNLKLLAMQLAAVVENHSRPRRRGRRRRKCIQNENPPFRRSGGRKSKIRDQDMRISCPDCGR